MNIYLVSRTDEVDFDEYDAMVVIAKDEQSAKDFTIKETRRDAWTLEESKLKVVLIGTANHGLKEKIVLDSFNAG
jgi:hypothetical protein